MPTELVHPPTETLGRQHDRASFSCGVPELDTHLRERAMQDQKKRAAVCWVQSPSDNPAQILGYYTLSAYSVGLRDLPEEQSRKLPRYPDVPAALLGRLAVDSRSRGLRVGEHLLMDAMAKVLEQSAAIATYALVVDAKDARAAAFYSRYDFIAFPTNPLRLFLPTATIAQLFQ